MLFIIVCLLVSSSRSLLNVSYIFSILFPRFWIIFTIITLNSISGRLLISSSFVWSAGFFPCSFICCVFLCLLILLNLLCLGSPFHRLQVCSSRCFWCLPPVAKVGSVRCVGLLVEGTVACVLVNEAGSCLSGGQDHVRCCVLGCLWPYYDFRQLLCWWLCCVPVLLVVWHRVPSTVACCSLSGAGLSIEMESSGRAFAVRYYMEPRGLWWTNFLNSALPSQRHRADTRLQHQDPVSHMEFWRPESCSRCQQGWLWWEFSSQLANGGLLAVSSFLVSDLHLPPPSLLGLYFKTRSYKSSSEFSPRRWWVVTDPRTWYEVVAYKEMYPWTTFVTYSFLLPFFIWERSGVVKTPRSSPLLCVKYFKLLYPRSWTPNLHSLLLAQSTASSQLHLGLPFDLFVCVLFLINRDAYLILEPSYVFGFCCCLFVCFHFLLHCYMFEVVEFIKHELLAHLDQMYFVPFLGE